MGSIKLVGMKNDVQTLVDCANLAIRADCSDFLDFGVWMDDNFSGLTARCRGGNACC